jgi:zinc protease
MPFRLRSPLPVLVLLALASLVPSSGEPARGATESASDVLKATLANGLRVVIVRNALAPVVSTDLAYLVGTRDDPAPFPGMAHAQEHMMFRGTPNLSTSELGTLATALGGNFNAATSDTITEFNFTVPAVDLDAVLRIESDRMRDVLDDDSQWRNERGAIEQEVLRDETSPGADFFRAAQALAFAGTDYAHQGVGTRAAFDRLTGGELKTFWRRWYAPNNAVFVVAGDLDPAQTLAQVRARFESIPARPVPAHAVAHFAPLRGTVLRQTSTLTYPLAAVGFRMPGLESPDFLASYLLQEVLNSPSGPMRALVDSGEALDGQWQSMPYLPEAQLAYATAALPPGADPNAMLARIDAVVAAVAGHGVPRELFEATKRRAIADQELSRNSIESLASDWATTIAVDGEPSIAREQELLAGVSLADVNRVAKKYLVVERTVAGALTPSGRGSPGERPAPPAQGPEKPLDTENASAHLPAWAQSLVEHVSLAPSQREPVRTTLANGIVLIVQPETISDSVFLFGSVRTNTVLQEPPGKEGVAAVLGGIFGEGTATLDRAAFQRKLDAIDTSLEAGPSFALQTTSHSFDGAVGLLAQNELAPRFDEATFELARRRAADQLATALGGSATLAERRAAVKLLPPGDPELREPTVAGMEQLSLDDVRAYAAATLRPDLTTIVIVGNVTPEAARGAVERAFGNWHAAGSTPQLDLPPVPLNAPGEVKVALPEVVQDNASFEQVLTLQRSSPDYDALELGNAIFGGGEYGPEQSRLFRDLRQNAGLVYSIGSRLSIGRVRSKFTIDFACSPENENRIATSIDAEIAKMKTEPVGDFELALMKASIVRRTILGDADETSIAQSLLGDANAGLPLDQDRIDAGRLMATDASAVRNAFATYIHPENFVRVIEGP